MYRLLLLRHGQSTANADGRFTGWVDVPLTREGERQARMAGELVRSAHLRPDVVHTSLFRRTIHTADIMVEVLDSPWSPVWRSWRLNERQYGALTGRRKADVLADAGAERFRSWRRSLCPSARLALNVPTGVPLCYEFDARLRPVHRGGRHLDPEAAARAAAAVALDGQTRSDCPEEAVR